MGSKLEGRVAIVTGGGSGIGRASCHALAQAGASVVVADLNPESAAAVAAEIEASGGRARGHACDVSSEEAVIGMIADAVEHYGGLDILHNNAAASNAEIMSRDSPVAEMALEIWDATLAVNLRGPMLGCKHAIPEMLKRGGGSIINTSSISGLVGDLSRSAYASSKAGVDALTRSVATQYGKQSIRCNAIAPGVIFTPAIERNVSKEHLDLYGGNHLTPRLGRPEDIAGMVVFLASDEAEFLTGQVVQVDGGLIAHHPTFAEFNKLGG